MIFPLGLALAAYNWLAWLIDFSQTGALPASELGQTEHPPLPNVRIVKLG
jgi:hypothetical protein